LRRTAKRVEQTCAIFSVIFGVLVNPYLYRNASRIIVPTFCEPGSDNRRPTLYYTSADFLTFVPANVPNQENTPDLAVIGYKLWFSQFNVHAELQSLTEQFDKRESPTAHKCNQGPNSI
jgi:hypothetical protein